VAYISGLGYYRLFINGEEVNTGALLNGAWTVYNKRVLYDSLNVSSYLQTYVPLHCRKNENLALFPLTAT
jgi:hypothetical protein